MASAVGLWSEPRVVPFFELEHVQAGDTHHPTTAAKPNPPGHSPPRAPHPYRTVAEPPARQRLCNITRRVLNPHRQLEREE